MNIGYPKKRKKNSKLIKIFNRLLEEIRILIQEREITNRNLINN